MSHCKTCTCERKKRCAEIVPASDYRKRGRCRKYVLSNYDWCTVHAQMRFASKQL